MSVETLTEALSGEPEENANSSAGTETSQEPVSFADELKAAETRIMREVTEGLKANRQSQTDTIDNRVTGMEATIISELTKLVPEGTDIQAIRERAWIQSQMGTSENDGSAERSPKALEASPSTTADLVSTEITQILQEHGVSADEPELADYMRANAGKRWSQIGAGFEDVVANIAERSKGSTPMGTGSGSAPNPNLEAAFAKEATELRATGRGYKERMNAYRELEAKYQAQGVDTAKVAAELL